ncbi:MAG: DUF2264 domain-containing protein [Haloarculaceae archaeon]
MNPLADNPLETRADFQRAAVRLFEPLRSHASDCRARVKPGAAGAHFSDVAAGLEGFARPLWGLAPLAAGGGAFDDWDHFRTGMAAGTDPDHPEYWGRAGDYSQKHVETAAIGFGLALAPDELWDPLDADAQERLVEYLRQVNDADLHDCNWLFFRVMVNLGLRSVGARYDRDLTRETLDRLESFYLGDGWYADGPEGERPCDYYVPWAMHTFGLAYAALAGDEDPERADRFRERAREFAGDYREWFRADGPGLPYGRSLTYRFAQSAFWGALAFADVEALPWGEIRGLWGRNVRWWAEQAIFAADGTLTVGYRYPAPKTSEPYNSPSSPYWAMKAFLPLALPESHPFWRAEERAPAHASGPVVQERPKLVVCRDERADHHFALTTGQNSQYLEKYAKFAYSTDFGFGVRSRASGLAGAGHDSALALREAGGRYRIRLSVADSTVDGTTLYSRWEPWPDVTVDTWLAPAAPWHARVHRVETGRSLDSAEGGFPLDRSGDDPDGFDRRTDDGSAYASYPNGSGGILDLDGSRTGRVVDQDPNTNLCFPRSTVPTLTATHGPGTHWLVSAVTAARADGDDRWGRSPSLDAGGGATVVRADSGPPILRCDGDAPGPLGEFPV